MIPLPYVSVSYLSKVNSGRKVVDWTRTLRQTLAVYMSQCTPPTFPPYTLSCPYLFIGLVNWVGGDEENATYRGTNAQFFLSVGLRFCKPAFLPGVAISLYIFSSPEPNAHR